MELEKVVELGTLAFGTLAFLSAVIPASFYSGKVLARNLARYIDNHYF